MQGFTEFFAGFDPVDTAPALIAVVIGLIVWRRHPVDRRARLFLALAASELAFALPLLLSLNVPRSPAGAALIDGLLVTIGLLSAALFLHFGLSFPHARPWLARGYMTSLYAAAVVMGVISAAVTFAEARAAVRDVFQAVLMLVGPLVLLASLTACVAIYRSYREMTADERRAYRVPVLGVLAGMIASMTVSLLIGVMFGLVFGVEHRYAIWTVNTLATAGELLLPLFFFMAAVKYRLIERHSQDYVNGN